VVPHPSGLTRFWNDEVDVMILRSDVEKLLA
jgi:hypothetical protein